MGTAISRNSDLTQNDYLKRFVSKESISSNDPFWNRLLSYNISPPTTSQDQLLLDSKLETLCQEMLSKNQYSHNLATLISIFLRRKNELKEADIFNNSVFAWQTFNMLFIIRCATKYLIETTSEEMLVLHLELSDQESKLIGDINFLQTFLDGLIQLLVYVPLNDLTYAIHLETINCLLILLSIHLYSQRRADNSEIYRYIITGIDQKTSKLLTKQLLQNIIDSQRAPPPYSDTHGGNSFVLGFAAEIWSYFSFGKNNDSQEQAQNNLPSMLNAPLANQSLLLLLVLTNHCTSLPNPYRTSLFSCKNIEDEATSFLVDFDALYHTICKFVHLDTMTLLLYLLLHRNQTFRNYLMSRNDIEILTVPIVRTLYSAPNSSSHHIYMSLIILLILSEEEIFNKSIHEIKIKPVPWYTERSFQEITLGGLLILVLIRIIQYNMLKMRDKYLHSNCLAALANMSSQFRFLHPYVSQRLVSLFETLAKKYIRVEKQITDISIGETEEGGTDTMDNLMQDLTVFEEVLRMILEIFNSCLSSQLVYNPNLVYTLLYKQQIFDHFRPNVEFQEVLQNIDIVIRFFSQRLETQHHDLDVNEVLNSIEKGTKEWSKENLKKLPDLKFKYVEEEQPEEFFIPYVWSLIFQNSLLRFSSENIKLFNMNEIPTC